VVNGKKVRGNIYKKYYYKITRMASCALDCLLVLHGTTPNRDIEFKAVSIVSTLSIQSD